MFNVHVDLAVDDKVGLGPGAQRRSDHRSRFPPSLSGADAYT